MSKTLASATKGHLHLHVKHVVALTLPFRTYLLVRHSNRSGALEPVRAVTESLPRPRHSMWRCESWVLLFCAFYDQWEEENGAGAIPPFQQTGYSGTEWPVHPIPQPGK